MARQTKTVRSYKGVEAGRVPVEFARNVLGIDVFCGQLEDANFGEREFDIVAMIHALEHVPHPRQMVRKIYRLLKDDGVLIVVVPSLQAELREGRSQSERGFSPNTTIHISRRKPLPGSLIERVWYQWSLRKRAAIITHVRIRWTRAYSDHSYRSVADRNRSWSSKKEQPRQ